MAKRAVFLDRDGVLNRAIVRDGKPYAPRRLQDFEIYPEAASVVQSLKNEGFLIIVVTNQPDVGNRWVEKSVVEAMHQKLAETVIPDAIKVCYHSQTAGCTCRKPKPGMLIEAAYELKIDLSRSFMVGDRASDVLAGYEAGCRTVLIDYDYAEQQIRPADRVVRSLPEAAAAIVQEIM